MRTQLGRIFGLTAIVALLAVAPILAQADMGNTATVGATYTHGVVEAFTTDSVTIAKDNGERVTMLIDVATVGAQQLATGQRVRIDFHVNDYNQGIADVIQIGDVVEPTTQVAAAPQVTVSESPIEPAEVSPATTAVAELPAEQPAAEPEVQPAAEPEPLPATASSLPMLALLGVLALAGSFTLRLLR